MPISLDRSHACVVVTVQTGNDSLRALPAWATGTAKLAMASRIAAIVTATDASPNFLPVRLMRRPHDPAATAQAKRRDRVALMLDLAESSV